MSGGHFNHVGHTVADALTDFACDAEVWRRWPQLSTLLVLVGVWFRELEHEADWDLSGDSALSTDDAEWQRHQIAVLLHHVLQATPDEYFPRGKWATIQAIQARHEAGKESGK